MLDGPRCYGLVFVEVGTIVKDEHDLVNWWSAERRLCKCMKTVW